MANEQTNAQNAAPISTRPQRGGSALGQQLRALAQYMLANGASPAMDNMTMGLGGAPDALASTEPDAVMRFDPSQEMPAQGMPTEEMAQHPRNEDERREMSVDQNKTHTLSITFKAPPDVTRADMMNFVLGIRDELGVDVEKFNWAKHVAKQATAAAQSRITTAQGFDPSQDNTGFNNMVGGNTSLNPGIQSFVQMKNGGEPSINESVTHTCAIVFKAPSDVSETDMMNYILGIEKELHVDVEKFDWSKQVAKVTIK